MRLGERNTSKQTPYLYLNSVKSCRRKTHLTSYDLELPEGEVMGSNVYLGHLEGLIQDNLDIISIISLVLSKYEALEHFPIAL